MTYEEADNCLKEFLTIHRNAARRFFQECGMFSGHPHLLFLVAKQPGITQKQLADEMQIAPATVAVSLRRLEEAGLLSRKPDAQDRRLVRVYLTAEGEAVDRRCREGREVFVQKQFDGFSEQDLQTFAALLRRIEENLQENGSRAPEGGSL